ncbi:MAG: GIY-YIG nuclease family protein [Patescibacteria group bacterium]
MMKYERQYYVYILANKFNRVLYTGVTNNLIRRLIEHGNKDIRTFTGKYKVTKLVYYEETNDVTVAIMREKQIKGWLRKRKIALIKSMNPNWKNLGKDLIPCHSER